MAIFERDFDYETLTYEQRITIHDALADTTIKHITASEGLFAKSDFNPAANPSHMLEVTHLDPVPTTRERIDGMAAAAGANLHAHAKDVFKKHAPFMSSVRWLLHEGNNIAVVTGPHGNIADVAIESEAYSEYLEQDNWQEQNGLIISRGVTTIDAFGTAASQVVQEIGHVFMSFPRTKTIEQLITDANVLSPEEFEQLVATNNRNMRKEAREWLGIHRIDLPRWLGRQAAGKTLHTAWEGKTADVRYGDNHRPESITFQKVHPAILDVIKHGFVLPVTIWEGEPEPVLEFGNLEYVKNEADIHRVQEWQRATLANRLGMPDKAVTIAS